MAEIGRRRQGEMLQGVLRILKSEPDGLQAAKVILLLEQQLPPTEFESAYYPKNPGVRRYPKIVRFSTIQAVKAGWLDKTKGIWTLMPEGAEALRNFSDPLLLIREAATRYRVWQKAQPDGEDDDAVIESAEEAPANATSALEEAEETAWAEIARYLSEMPPYDFQELVAALLRAMGYFVSYVSPPGPDQGVDVLAFTDPLGAVGPRIKVQVRRRKDRTRAEDVRAFMALLAHQDVGLFVATGGFTSDAEREVRAQEVRRIRLISAEQLFDLWVAHYDKVPDTHRQLLPLRAVQFLAAQD